MSFSAVFDPFTAMKSPELTFMYWLPGPNSELPPQPIDMFISLF